jgi:hypothetical protein
LPFGVCRALCNGVEVKRLEKTSALGEIEAALESSQLSDDASYCCGRLSPR